MRPLPAHNPALAALLITLATVFIAATTLLAKALGTETLGAPLHPLQISHGRFLFAFMAISGAVAVLRFRLQRPQWGIHLGRTSCGWLGTTLMFAAVAHIPLADATAITFLNPVFAMMLAIPLLGERVGPWRWGSAGLAMVGAMILLRPTPASFQIAAVLALAAALVFGLELIFIKKLAGREHPLHGLVVQQCFGCGDRQPGCSAGLADTNRAAMGSTGRAGGTHGLCPGLFCQWNGPGRCFLCGALQLCHPGFCHPL